MASTAQQYYCSADKWYGPLASDNNKKNLSAFMPVGRPGQSTLYLFKWQQLRLLEYLADKHRTPVDELDFPHLLATPASDPQLLDFIWPWQNNLQRNDTDIAAMAAALRRWAGNSASALAGQVANGVFRRDTLKYPDPRDLVPVPQTTQLLAANDGNRESQQAQSSRPQPPSSQAMLEAEHRHAPSSQTCLEPTLRDLYQTHQHPEAQEGQFSHSASAQQHQLSQNQYQPWQQTHNQQQTHKHSETGQSPYFSTTSPQSQARVRTERADQTVPQTQHYPARQSAYEPFKQHPSLSPQAEEEEGEHGLEDGRRLVNVGHYGTNPRDSHATGSLSHAGRQRGQGASDRQHSEEIPGAFPSTPDASSQAPAQHAKYSAQPASAPAYMTQSFPPTRAAPTIQPTHPAQTFQATQPSQPAFHPQSIQQIPSGQPTSTPLQTTRYSSSNPFQPQQPSQAPPRTPQQPIQPSHSTSTSQYASPSLPRYRQAPPTTPQQPTQLSYSTSTPRYASPSLTQHQHLLSPSSAHPPPPAQPNLENLGYRQSLRPQQLEAMQSGTDDPDALVALVREFQNQNLNRSSP